MKQPDFQIVATPTADGHLPKRTRLRILARLKTHAGVETEIVIRPYKAKRSGAQNRRYWALLTVGARALWGDPSESETLHEEVAHLLLALPVCEKTGLRRRQRTPKLNTQEFGDYMELVAMKLIELGADLSEWDAESERIERAA